MGHTLIIPAAGKSSRFPGVKPKYLLTHADGRLMIEHVIDACLESNKNQFSTLAVTILQQHQERYQAATVLKQLIEQKYKQRYKFTSFEIVCLSEPTTSAAQTVAHTITELTKNPEHKRFSNKHRLTIKDCDSVVEFEVNEDDISVVGVDLQDQDVRDVAAKSFIVYTGDNIVTDIVEKSVISNIVCTGVYGFQSAVAFLHAYSALRLYRPQEELYVSQVMQYMITNGYMPRLQFAKRFEDWGTLERWRDEQARHKTYFWDIDGVICKNIGKYGDVNWMSDHNIEFLPNNLKTLKKLYNAGNRIILTTSRPLAAATRVVDALRYDHDIHIDLRDVIVDLPHSGRVLINDFAPTNPYPSATAINVERDQDNVEAFVD